jgi:hypothetical protein
MQNIRRNLSMKKVTILVLLLVLFIAAATATANPRSMYTADLAGAFEVPAVITAATGEAFFRVSADGSSLGYRLNVRGLTDTLQAHIHLGPAGQNGPVVAFLYPDAPPAQLIPGRFSGELAGGAITADELRGPLEGMTIADLLAAIESGNAYVNVHTVANPGGEIRGQIQ